MTKGSRTSTKLDVVERIDRFTRIFSNLRGESDRAVVILIGAYFESLVEAWLRARLLSADEVGDLTKDEVKSIMDPVPTAVQRAKIVLLLGGISLKHYRQLHRIASVRNMFAHRVETASFDDEDVKKGVNKLFEKADPKRVYRKAFIAAGRDLAVDLALALSLPHDRPLKWEEFEFVADG